ncbi:MAG: hypothetical protein RSB77_07065 [Bacilli bacterium]
MGIKKKLTTVVGVLALISLLMIGCSNSNETKLEKDNQYISKISMQDSLNDVKKKLVEASFYDEMDQNKKSMDESIEYAKSILPDGIKEIDKTYKKDLGITRITYELDGFEFMVSYYHPLGKNTSENNEYDLQRTSGVVFKGISFENMEEY